jgi:hypothetical protein
MIVRLDVFETGDRMRFSPLYPRATWFVNDLVGRESTSSIGTTIPAR